MEDSQFKQTGNVGTLAITETVEDSFIEEKQQLASAIAMWIWLLTTTALAIGCLVLSMFKIDSETIQVGFAIFIFSLLFSSPVLIILLIIIPSIGKLTISFKAKFICLIVACFLCTLVYGLIGGWNFYDLPSAFQTTVSFTSILFGCSLVAIAIIHKMVIKYFKYSSSITTQIIQITPKQLLQK